jgi:hypothetical protein
VTSQKRRLSKSERLVALLDIWLKCIREIVMVTHIPQSNHERHRRQWWRSLRLWQRAVVVAVLLGTLIVSAGLIYYGPRLQTAAPAGGATSTTTTTPESSTVPGTDPWYSWGQHQPLDQQP